MGTITIGKPPWTEETIKHKLMTDDRWLYKAVLAIYERQTADEQSSKSTKYSNRVGFNGPDAPVMSYYAKWLKEHGELTGKHLIAARNKILKYSGQLAKIANGEL